MGYGLAKFLALNSKLFRICKQKIFCHNAVSPFLRSFVPSFSRSFVLSFPITPEACMASATCCGMSSAEGSMESARRAVWNQCASIVWNQARRKGDIHASHDAMRSCGAIPCNSRSELMPCQALRAWIKKRQISVEICRFFGDPSGNRTHAFAVRGRRLSRLTMGPCHATCLL